MANFNDLQKAHENRKKRQLAVISYVKLLALECIPEALNLASDTSLVAYYDVNTCQIIRKGDGLPWYFGNDATIGITIRVEKHAHIPFILTFKYLSESYLVRCRIYSQEVEPGFREKHVDKEFNLREKEIESDLRELAKGICEMALYCLDTTFGTLGFK